MFIYKYIINTFNLPLYISYLWRTLTTTSLLYYTLPQSHLTFLVAHFFLYLLLSPCACFNKYFLGPTTAAPLIYKKKVSILKEFTI